MKTQFDVNEIIESGKIGNELDYERALIADRKLRVLAKDDSKKKSLRKKLRDIIEAYEHENWSGQTRIGKKKLRESDIAEAIAEKERLFIKRRRELIRDKLKKHNLSQQDLGTILGHKSKTYMSELMNGISPFSLKDLIIISRLFGLGLSDLIPTFLTQNVRLKVKSAIEKFHNPELRLSKDDFVLA